MSSPLDKHKTSMAGEFLVAGMLNAMGHVASLTLKNYPSVDIFVLRDDGVQRQIQVKTTREDTVNFGAGSSDKPARAIFPLAVSGGGVPASRYRSRCACTSVPSAALARCGVSRPSTDTNHHRRSHSR